jgi:transposase-like protein
MSSTSSASLAESRRQRPTYTREQIQQHLRALQSSGLSAAAYARQEGLRYTTLANWRRATRQPRLRRHAQPKFQTVPLSSLMGSAWAAEVVGPSGVTVRLSAQAPAALVLQLISLTSGAC